MSAQNQHKNPAKIYKRKRVPCRDIERDHVKLDRLQEVKESYDGLLNKLINEMSQTDLEWLQLCSAGKCGPSIEVGHKKSQLVDTDNEQAINTQNIDIMPSTSSRRDLDYESDE